MILIIALLADDAMCMITGEFIEEADAVKYRDFKI